MIQKIVVNSKRTQATIMFDNGKVFNLSHSEGQVVELLNEFIFAPIELQSRSEEVTQVIELDEQLSLFDMVA